MPTLISAAQLRPFATNCDYTALAPMLDREAQRCEISTPRRIRHWLAHLHHESQGFTRLEEGLFYKTPGRLKATWPTRFKTLEAEAPYLRNPQALANKVYGGRMGNSEPNDGWLYRGGAWIQLTGKDNYRRASAWTGLDLVKSPELARTPSVACVIAADFWRVEGLNAIVDVDAGEAEITAKVADVAERIKLTEGDDLRQGTDEINGGLNGVEDRMRQLIRAGAIWSD
ncbi:MAG: putative baseplate assembly protein [Caulobacter sp.]|nr:putative baseplate assembly protein [Caulobacter sp.]